MNDLLVLSKNTPVVHYHNGNLTILEEALAPLYLKRTGNLECWLATRAIDEHRTNSRLLKKALRLRERDDVSTVLHFNAVTVTDTYWVKEAGSPLTYEDVRFTENSFDTLALRGDPNGFNQPPSRTPELTNTGSYEKCWRLEDGKWWMYKSGSQEERYSELFACELAKKLGIPVAQYEPAGPYIKSLDFTDDAAVNLESAFSIIGEETEYPRIYDALFAIRPSIAKDYVAMCYLDALIFNMDRHEHNFGVLRDPDTGEVLRLAPLYDHNIALISRGYPVNVARKPDMLVDDFLDLLAERSTGFQIPDISKHELEQLALGVGVPISKPESAATGEEFVRDFVWNAQQRICAYANEQRATIR